MQPSGEVTLQLYSAGSRTTSNGIGRGNAVWGPYRGGEAVVEHVWPDRPDEDGFAVTPRNCRAGDTVAAVVRYTGTGKVTGKTLDVAP